MKKFFATILLIALCLTVSMPALAAPADTVTPTSAQGMAFTDVRPGDWFFGYVQFVHTSNVMQGTSPATFAPNATFSRAQVAATLFRIHNGRPANASDNRTSPFVDVQTSDWFAPYIVWANAMNIVFGVGDNRFDPNADVDRQQLATMLMRYVEELTDFNPAVSSAWYGRWNVFADRNQTAPWAYNALMVMNYHGIITGRAATTVAPTGTATRAEAAAMLTRIINLLAGNSASTPPTEQVPPSSNPALEEAVRSGMNYREVLRAFPGADVQTAFEQEVIRLVNEIRREYGLPPLIYHPDLARIARGRTDEMVRYNTMGHVSPTTGLAHTDHARAMGVDVFFAGENAGWERGAPRYIVNAWMDSPPHRDFILSGAPGSPFTIPWAPLPYIGVGFSFGDSVRNAWTLWQMTPLR